MADLQFQRPDFLEKIPTPGATLAGAVSSIPQLWAQHDLQRKQLEIQHMLADAQMAELRSRLGSQSLPGTSGESASGGSQTDQGVVPIDNEFVDQNSPAGTAPSPGQADLGGINQPNANAMQVGQGSPQQETPEQYLSRVGTEKAGLIQKMEGSKIYVNQDPNAKPDDFSLTPKAGYAPLNSQTFALWHAAKTPGTIIETLPDGTQRITTVAPGTKVTPTQASGGITPSKVPELVSKFDDALNPQKNQNTAKNQARVDNADRVLNLLDQSATNPNVLQAPEAAQMVAQMLSASGNRVAQEQVEHLIPSSFKGDLEKKLSYILNEPRGTDQQAFFDSLKQTAVREKGVAADQVKRDVQAAIPTGETLRRTAPDQWANIMKARGFDPANYKNGQYQESSQDKSPVNSQTGLPSIGELFQGHKVLAVKKIK